MKIYYIADFALSALLLPHVTVTKLLSADISITCILEMRSLKPRKCVVILMAHSNSKARN